MATLTIEAPVDLATALGKADVPEGTLVADWSLLRDVIRHDSDLHAEELRSHPESAADRPTDRIRWLAERVDALGLLYEQMEAV